MSKSIFNDVCRNYLSIIAEVVACFHRVELAGNLVVELV